MDSNPRDHAEPNGAGHDAESTHSEEETFAPQDVERIESSSEPQRETAVDPLSQALDISYLQQRLSHTAAETGDLRELGRERERRRSGTYVPTVPAAPPPSPNVLQSSSASQTQLGSPGPSTNVSESSSAGQTQSGSPVPSTNRTYLPTVPAILPPSPNVSESSSASQTQSGSPAPSTNTSKQNILLKICLSPFKFAWKIAWKTIWGAIGINKAVPIVFLGYCLYTLGVFLRFLADILRTNHEPLEPLEDGRVGERLYQSPGQNEHDVETGFRILDRRDAIEAAASGNAGDVHAQRSLNNGLEGVRSGLSTEASTDRSEPNDNGPSTPVQQISGDAIQGPTRYRRGSVTDSLLPEESQDFQSSGSASDHDMEQDNAPNVMPSGTDTDVDQTYDPRGSMPLASVGTVSYDPPHHTNMVASHLGHDSSPELEMSRSGNQYHSTMSSPEALFQGEESRSQNPDSSTDSAEDMYSGGQ